MKYVRLTPVVGIALLIGWLFLGQANLVFASGGLAALIPLVRLENKVLLLDAVEGCKFEREAKPKQPFIYILSSSDSKYESAKIGAYFAYLGLDNDLSFSTEGFTTSLKRRKSTLNSESKVSDLGSVGRFKLLSVTDLKNNYFRIVALLNPSMDFKYYTTVFYRNDLVLVTKFDSLSNLDAAVAFEKKILSSLKEGELPAEQLAKLNYPVITPDVPAEPTDNSPKMERRITAKPGSQVSVSHLCAASEKVFFACETVNQKLISICSSPDLSGSVSSLQYRYGTKKKTELQFPTDLRQSPEKFFYAHYSRAQTDYKTLSFKNGKVQYSVFENFDGTSQPSDTAGVTVKTSENAKEVSVACKSTVYSKLEELSDYVSCDPNDALNMGSCSSD